MIGLQCILTAFNKVLFGLIFGVNVAVHVRVTNDDPVEMPHGAVCHTERREEAQGAEATPGLANHTPPDTHTHTTVLHTGRRTHVPHHWPEFIWS